jgi:hypothetical protein
MTRLAKLAAPLAVAAAVLITSAPAKAQFDEGQMAQFAPMLEMMKQKMGKKRFGHMMQTMGPMMENMMGQGGGGGGFGGGGFGGGGGMGGFDVNSMQGLMNPQMMGSMIGMFGGMRHGSGRSGRRHGRGHRRVI